ncbi:transposase [Oenococcus oeni]|nr:transposase [Oenococcus oeni S22]OIK61234.1 IS5 family transposase [Oenococcus oeni]OIM07823.1 IS5 family transposase [Oenococcus oeni]OIM65482.1 IS5 family transposase [Oenococcus oeni]PDH74685.1 transposase [Oenococcus oeni]
MTDLNLIEPNRHAVSDEKWLKIEQLLPPYTTGRPFKLTNRQALDAILWFLKIGSPWRDLPQSFGSWKTVYSRYRKWADAGLFEQIFCQLIEMPDMENISLDFTNIRVHQKATGAQKKPAVMLKTKLLG